MSEEANKAAWDREVDTMRQLLARQLNMPAESEDIRRAALGVLLIGTSPDPVFRVALQHVRMDMHRRGWLTESQELVPPSNAPPSEEASPADNRVPEVMVPTESLGEEQVEALRQDFEEAKKGGGCVPILSVPRLPWHELRDAQLILRRDMEASAKSIGRMGAMCQIGASIAYEMVDQFLEGQVCLLGGPALGPLERAATRPATRAPDTWPPPAQTEPNALFAIAVVASEGQPVPGFPSHRWTKPAIRALVGQRLDLQEVAGHLEAWARVPLIFSDATQEAAAGGVVRSEDDLPPASTPRKVIGSACIAREGAKGPLGSPWTREAIQGLADRDVLVKEVDGKLEAWADMAMVFHAVRIESTGFSVSSVSPGKEVTVSGVPDATGAEKVGKSERRQRLELRAALRGLVQRGPTWQRAGAPACLVWFSTTYQAYCWAEDTSVDQWPVICASEEEALELGLNWLDVTLGKLE